MNRLLSLLLGVLLAVSLLSCSHGQVPSEPVQPRILGVSVPPGMLLPGQQLTLESVTTGEIDSFEWTIGGTSAKLVANNHLSATVELIREGPVSGVLSIAGPAGSDSLEFEFRVASPRIPQFSTVIELPALPGSDIDFAQRAYGLNVVLAHDRLWMVYTVSGGVFSSGYIKLILAHCGAPDLENPESWQFLEFSERYTAVSSLFETDGRIVVIYSQSASPEPDGLIVAIATRAVPQNDADFRKTLLTELHPLTPGKRLVVHEGALLALSSVRDANSFARPALARLPLTQSVTAADLVKGELPGGFGSFWDPIMTSIQGKIAIAWAYNAEQYILVRNSFPPWDIFSFSALPFTHGEVQVTGLGPWGTSGLIMGFSDLVDGRQYYTTSSTLTPILEDWSTPVEVPQTLLGRPVMWAGRQVWHTNSTLRVPNQEILARTIAAPPSEASDLIFTPFEIDMIGRSEVPTMLDFDGRLIIVHPYDPDGNGPEPQRIRLLQSDGPW